jgi:hypothetical protein
MTSSIKRVSIAAAAAAVLFGAAPVSYSAYAQSGDTQRETTTEATEPDPRPPQTAEEHRARADRYKKKAAEYRQEANAHRKMLADYASRMAPMPRQENPWLKKMRVHCQQYIKSADALAREADRFAEYHSLRAAEMEGR